jgi:galactofuranosylgalactofuranosylrhamnosyl-N-acetylglucosaminyl-diphospho-decaprenol beta-1,5/1,6-galactofuranosyltransferase
VSERVLHRVVFPDQPDPDVAPLYWDVGDQATGTVDHLVDRHRARLPAGTRASTATYFNAFPAGYWRRWTTVSEVSLTVRVAGEDGTVAVYRSTPDGRQQRVHMWHVSSTDGSVDEHTVTLPLASFADGGWLWFDVAAGRHDLTLESASYTTRDAAARTGTCTVSITTFNRPAWCVRLLHQLSVAVDEMPEIDRVQLVDHGTSRVVDHPAFADLHARMGQSLRVVEQPNLGGAGGFARGMADTLVEGRSDYVLLLDDDVIIERESIRRALAFADLTRVPTLVGGHMFSAYAPASLHSFGEVVDPDRFWWQAAPNTQVDHDFGGKSLRDTGWMHRRVDVDYNGWWMCLIPVEAIDKLGLALPVFIKWDDAEYGLRAGEAGYPTVSLPGVALWHIPWSDKDDSVDWQAYFHLRNRLVAALLHSSRNRGGMLLPDILAHQVKHIASMQYSAARLRLMAVEDVLRGPGHLAAEPTETLARVRAARDGHDDALVRPTMDAFPAPAPSARAARFEGRPRGRAELIRRAARGVVHQLRPVARSSYDRPDVALPAPSAQWWTLSTVDSAVVSLRDGTGYAWYRRHPALARDLVARSIAAHANLARQWGSLSAAYREGLPDLVSRESWTATFTEAL